MTLISVLVAVYIMEQSYHDRLTSVNKGCDDLGFSNKKVHKRYIYIYIYIYRERERESE